MSRDLAAENERLRAALVWLTTHAMGPGEDTMRRAQLVAADALHGRDWRQRLTATQARAEPEDEP